MVQLGLIDGERSHLTFGLGHIDVRTVADISSEKNIVALEIIELKFDVYANFQDIIHIVKHFFSRNAIK